MDGSYGASIPDAFRRKMRIDLLLSLSSIVGDEIAHPFGKRLFVKPAECSHSPRIARSGLALNF
jgi:hypothetical protein